jgi:hypothetical protein
LDRNDPKFRLGSEPEALEAIASYTGKLPAPGEAVRWTPRRKVAMLNQLATGGITQEAASRLYGTSAEELAEWRRAYEAHGLKGMRTTRGQMYRSGMSKRWTK